MARINLMNTALGNMIDISSTGEVGDGAGERRQQRQRRRSGAADRAEFSLDQLLALLNAQAGDRYLFSGRATDTPAVETLDHILNGNGARAGLKQLITERNQADLGADGRGRLTIGAGGPNIRPDRRTGDDVRLQAGFDHQHRDRRNGVRVRPARPPP